MAGPQRDSFSIDDDETNPFTEAHIDADTAAESAQLPNYAEAITNSNEESGTTTHAANTDLPPGLFNYYSRYFQLTADDFFVKIKRAFAFKRKSYSSETERDILDPSYASDLYGPLWVTAFVAFVSFFVLTATEMLIYGILKGSSSSLPIASTNDYRVLTHTFGMLMIYAFLVPFLVYKMLERDENNSPPTVVSIMSFCGYMNINWLPVVVILSALQPFTEAIPLLIIPQILFPSLCGGKLTLTLLHELDYTNIKQKTTIIILLGQTLTQSLFYFIVYP